MPKKIFLFLILIFIFTPMFFVDAYLPINILIVPGHDDEVWGAQYGNIKEADMNLRLGTELFNILKKDKRFNVKITRDKNGYVKEFADYFSKNKEEIISFKEKAKKETEDSILNNSFIKKESVPHVSASEDMAIKLYGINKWANENKIDAVIHIHFNDYPRENNWTIGEYKGFAIYVPEEQMLNFKGSNDLAKNIFKQLHKKYITSTYKDEKGGLIQDQSLIALGSNKTLLPSARSLLVEYGYIYRFKNTTLRHKAYIDMAKRTAIGVKEYFFPNKK